MRRFWLAIGLAAVLGGGAAAWFYFHSLPAGAQWAAYQVGAAPTFSLAKRQLRALDQGKSRQADLRELAAGWGTGNARFDLYLAQYLGEPECSDAMREAFSLELSWRSDLLPRWAHYWSWRAKEEPGEVVISIADYLSALASLDPPRRLTWRETLDLQAAMSLTGHAELARRLTPDNWSGRFHQWVDAKAGWQAVVRPASPLPLRDTSAIKRKRPQTNSRAVRYGPMPRGFSARKSRGPRFV